MENLPEYLVALQLGLMGFIVGWATPRGKYLKALQLRVLRSLTNWLK